MTLPGSDSASRRRAAPLGVALLAACGGSSEPSAPAAPEGAAEARELPWFEPVEEAAGVRFVHVRGPRTRYWFPEIMGGGAAFLDHDGDGDLDLYCVQSGDLDPQGAGPGNQLYRNRGDGTFEDVSAAAGVDHTGYGMGVACGDYDADGDVDLYVTNVGPNVLYRNEGDGTFTDVTAATGTGDEGWGTSAAFLDVEGDGDLDLFVVNYLTWSIAGERECFAGSGARDYCHPNDYGRPARDVLYLNRGDGTFEDASERLGLGRAFGNGLGVAVLDFDRDGRMDVYVANDGMPNQLWKNHGPRGFTDEALYAGCAVNRQGTPEASMGVTTLDPDADGYLDLFVSHLRDESNTYYRNAGGLFDDATAALGLAGPSIDFTGFGQGFHDFDLDGRLDLYVANGRVGRWEPAWSAEDPYAEPDLLLRGLGDGSWAEVLPRGGTAQSWLGTGRAAAFGDYDGDGRVDVFVVNSGGRGRLLRNATGDGVGRGRHWIALRVVSGLEGREADALGAQVALEAGGRRQARTVQPSGSYCASHDPRVHFGLGDSAEPARVSVTWPDGRREDFGALAADRLHVLRRGTGSPPER